MTETMLIDDDADASCEGIKVFRVSDNTSSVMHLPERFGEAIDFLAHSWWRRTLIKLISGGRIEFFP